MRANLLSLLTITTTFSFLQASSPDANSARGSKTLQKQPTDRLDSTTESKALQKHLATARSDFCDRDRGKILFMADAVILAKVRHFVLHFQHILVHIEEKNLLHFACFYHSYSGCTFYSYKFSVVLTTLIAFHMLAFIVWKSR